MLQLMDDLALAMTMGSAWGGSHDDLSVAVRFDAVGKICQARVGEDGLPAFAIDGELGVAGGQFDEEMHVLSSVRET